MMARTSPRKVMSLSKGFSHTDAKRADYLRQELIRLRITAAEQFFKLGDILKEIRDKEYWKMGYHSFETYFADPEIGLRRSTAYHAIKLVETFKDWSKYTNIPVSKLIMIAPHINEKNKTDLIVAEGSLSRSDLRHELLSHGYEPERSKGVQLPKIHECNVCHGAKGIRWDDLCHCGWTAKQIEHVGKLVDKVEIGGGGE